MPRPRVRKNPVPGHHKAHHPWPEKELREWLIELMIAFEGNILQASKAVGRHHQAINYWLGSFGINHRDYYPSERLVERGGRIVGLRISDKTLAVLLVRDDAAKPMTLRVPATPAWRRQFGAVFGMKVVVVGVFESDRKGGRRFAVRSVTQARGRAVVTKRRGEGAAKRSGRVATPLSPDDAGGRR